MAYGEHNLYDEMAGPGNWRRRYTSEWEDDPRIEAVDLLLSVETQVRMNVEHNIPLLEEEHDLALERQREERALKRKKRVKKTPFAKAWMMYQAQMRDLTP